MTDFPVPGPPATMKATFCWFWPAAADRIHDRVVGDLLFVEEREDRLVADDARDVVEQALVRAEGGRCDSVEDGAVVRAGDALRRGTSRERPTGRRRRTGSCARSVAKSAW